MRSRDLITALDEAPLGRFHLRAVVASGVGFFTDAYDLFVIGIASALITQGLAPELGPARPAQRHDAGRGLPRRVGLRPASPTWSAASACTGWSRRSWSSARWARRCRPSYWVLIAFRFVLGFGVGGDYPVSAVLMSEYANRKDRGKLVGMVFGTQALGLIVGPLIALALLGAGRRQRRGLAGHARARRGARGGRDLPAPPDAGVAALPGPGAGPRRSRRRAGSLISPAGQVSGNGSGAAARRRWGCGRS